MYEYRELRSEQERRRRARHAARVASRPRKAAERVKLDMARLRQGSTANRRLSGQLLTTDLETARRRYRFADAAAAGTPPAAMNRFRGHRRCCFSLALRWRRARTKRRASHTCVTQSSRSRPIVSMSLSARPRLFLQTNA